MSAQEGAAAFAGLVDLAARTVGGKALYASDDFFAEKENLVEPGRGVFLADKYTERGKWMDGWESRRKRVPGHDDCIVKLGVRGSVHGVDIDTNHFLGNHPPFASLEACDLEGDPSVESLLDEVEWKEILPASPLKLGSQNLFAVSDRGPFTHVRLRIYPDGGVARLKVLGVPVPAKVPEGRIDLMAVVNGARAVACSDMFFSPMVNLILPTPAENMGGGWETRRRRAPGNEWIIVKLAAPGTLEELEIDTAFFKGNYPDRCAVDGIVWPDAPITALVPNVDGTELDWQPVLRTKKLQADHAHRFTDLVSRGPFTHLRLRIFPCGGVSRMRAWGTVASLEASSREGGLGRLNGLPREEAEARFLKCCGSTRWARAMAARRPFVSLTELLGVAEATWWRLGDGNWREAFGHHPEIGADVAKLREKFAATATWSAGEQAG
ncbi:MAG: allantoicase, partial [Deltaproteobacteria bacterium]|nr:allantoicase [Deltaproteobacteria bacterium]